MLIVQFLILMVRVLVAEDTSVISFPEAFAIPPLKYLESRVTSHYP